MTDPLIQRSDAAQATLDEFRDKPFRMGERDCVRLVAAHLRRLGYQVRLPSQGSYRTVKAARKVLAERGHASLAEALDALGLSRIPPAAALVGDVVQGASDDGLGALAVKLDRDRMVGYHPDIVGADVLQPLDLVLAWRVDPR